MCDYTTQATVHHYELHIGDRLGQLERTLYNPAKGEKICSMKILTPAEWNEVFNSPSTVTLLDEVLLEGGVLHTTSIDTLRQRAGLAQL